MSASHASTTSARRLVESILAEYHPKTVAELVSIALANNPLNEMNFVECVKSMVDEGFLPVAKPIYKTKSVSGFLRTPTLAGWFWATVTATLFSIVAIAVTPDLFPVSLVKWILGSALVLYLPGYAFLRFLNTDALQLDRLERFALSLGVSLVLVSLIAVALNYTPWWIGLPTITASLGTFTIAMAIAAAMREYFDLNESASELGVKSLG